MSLIAVILPVPKISPSIKGKERVVAIRKASREALRVCAYLKGISLGKLEQKPNGAPLPFAGNYWSVSHKPNYAAAVIGKAPIGIDIEEIKPQSETVVKKVISEKESSLCGENKHLFFFRVWTAKEAVLKAEGIGLAGLSKCRVIKAPDETTMFLKYEKKTYAVKQISIKGHLASVTTRGEALEWALPSS